MTKLWILICVVYFLMYFSVIYSLLPVSQFHICWVWLPWTISCHYKSVSFNLWQVGWTNHWLSIWHHRHLDHSQLLVRSLVNKLGVDNEWENQLLDICMMRHTDTCFLHTSIHTVWWWINTNLPFSLLIGIHQITNPSLEHAWSNGGKHSCYPMYK